MNKKRIAIFSLAYDPLIGGAEIALKEIITRLPDFDFFIFTNRFHKADKEKEVKNNITIIRLGSGKGINIINKILYPFRTRQAFIKENNNQPFSLQWAMMATYAGIASLLVKYKFPKLPYLLTDQSGDSDWFLFKRTWFWRYFYKQIYRRADYIQVISQWLKKRVLKYGYAGPIELVPNGVDVKVFKNNILTEAEKNRLKAGLGFGADDRIIISPSRLVIKNGLHDLIACLAHLPGKYKLLIIGNGRLLYKLKQQALGLGVSDRVYFLEGVEHRQLAKLYAISFAMCRPSLSEGFGNVFVEAMAAGLPVVGTEVGGIPDIITNNENGLLAPVKHPVQLAKTLFSLEDADLRQKLINNGLLTSQKYDWDGVAEKIKVIIYQLIN